MNKWIGIGRIVADPQISMLQSGIKIAKYRLAVNRAKKQDGTQDADFINCVCFNKAADFVERYLNKGMKIAVVGRIQTGSYEKDGQKIYTTDIVVEEHEFCEAKNNSSSSTQPQNNDFSTSALDDFSPVASDDGDLPF